MQGCNKVSKVALLFFILVPICSAFSADIKYQVRPGDTLYSIASRHDIDHQDLMEANRIQDARELKAGQLLIIPQRDIGISRGNLEDYEIQGGDTLYGISRRTGMSVQDILNFNHLSKDDIIKPGQVLHLRPSATLSIREDTPTERVVQVSSRNESAPSNISRFWPHNGERFNLDGKFPGIVIKGSIGDDIHAVSSGRVVYSGPHSTLGHVAFIQNSRGYIFIYGGNRTLLVSSGDDVRSGQVIGKLGPSPLLPEVQVYFSVWKEGKYIDPSTSLR